MAPLLPLALTLTLTSLVAPPAPDIDAMARQGHWLEEAWPAHSQLMHKPAPALALSGWLNGEVTAQQMKGKIVVIDFWATWCGPCRAAIPHNNELVRKYGPKGVLLFGACGGGREERMAEVAKADGLTYPTAKVSADSVKGWEVRYWPTYAILDRKGEVRALGIKPAAVEPILEALLAE